MIFVNFTVTTVTFEVKPLIHNMLSGDKKGGSRVAEVTVEAVFLQKTHYF